MHAKIFTGPFLGLFTRFLTAFVALAFALRLSPAVAQTIHPIYAFTNSGFSSPRDPNGDLILGTDGNFYGTTQYGGSRGFGTVFKITPVGGLTVLATFGGSVTGGTPSGELTFGPDGSLYGTTFFDGPGGQGTVFRVTTDGVLTILYSFSRLVSNTNADGAGSRAGLTLGPDGCFYGTTSAGGSGGMGTLFRMTTNGVLTNIFSFEAVTGAPSTNTTGAQPYARLTLGLTGASMVRHLREATRVTGRSFE
jgi:uncharacterized repeat protein (TIGR03803 family)